MLERLAPISREGYTPPSETTRRKPCTRELYLSLCKGTTTVADMVLVLLNRESSDVDVEFKRDTLHVRPP